MPTYEYACKSCKKHVEVVQSFKDEPLRVCPSCKGELRKVFGNIGISFKGSGFYKTDSRGKATSASTPKTESTTTESAKTEANKSESAKSDTKADTAKSNGKSSADSSKAAAG